MKKLQWHSFEKKIYINSTLEQLYKLWATQEGITSWFLRDAIYKTKDQLPRANNDLIEPGDTYKWYWHNWDGEGSGEILEANSKDFLLFSFEGSKVSVQLEEKKNAIIVTLRQFEIPEDDESKLKVHFGCSNGWTFWLTNLKAYVEHGILLNETEKDLKEHELSGWIFVNM